MDGLWAAPLVVMCTALHISSQSYTLPLRPPQHFRGAGAFSTLRRLVPLRFRSLQRPQTASAPCPAAERRLIGGCSSLAAALNLRTKRDAAVR